MQNSENSTHSKPVPLDCTLEAKPFKRENRYLVMKRTDLKGALTELEQTILEHIALKIMNYRAANDKDVLRCVVVESDWPEYAPTWATIEKRMRGL